MINFPLSSVIVSVVEPSKLTYTFGIAFPEVSCTSPVITACAYRPIEANTKPVLRIFLTISL